MAIRDVVTRGFGNGTFSPGVNDLPTRGYTIDSEVQYDHICVGTISLAAPSANSIALAQPSANSVSLAQPSANNIAIEDCV